MQHAGRICEVALAEDTTSDARRVMETGIELATSDPDEQDAIRSELDVICHGIWDLGQGDASEGGDASEEAPEDHLPELTQEHVQAELADVATKLSEAWDGRADDYEELSREITSVAQGLLDSHAPLVGDFEPYSWQYELEWLAENGVAELGSEHIGYEWFPPWNFTSFTVIGVPGAPATIYAGAHEVGDEWVAGRVALPGTYVTYGVEGCYWERLDDAGNILDNNFINAAPRVAVTIQPPDYAFNSEGCGRWSQTD